MFHVSVEPYWLAQDDWIFENDATAFLLAKILPKWISHIWNVWIPTYVVYTPNIITFLGDNLAWDLRILRILFPLT